MAADRLEANLGAFRALAAHVGGDQAKWRPDPAQWSFVEVVNHLADEEAEDFRRRLELTLARTGEPWPPIDPQGWAESRDYQSRALGPSLDRFAAERERSVRWLHGLGDVDLDASYAHPALGTMRARDLLASWLAHDLIHIRQLTRLHYRWLEREAALGAPPTRLDYAGPF